MAISNELMVGSEGSQYLALRPDSEIREALTANLQTGETITPADLVRIPTPAGGGLTWQWIDGGNNEQTAKAIEGILVYFGVRGTLWPTIEATADTKPVLVSYDLEVAHRVSDDIGDLDEDALEACRIGDRLYNWKALPWNQWDTGKDGVGKRCKESRILAVLRKEDAWPVLITAGPGSVDAVSKFVKRLTCAFYRAEVSVGLVATKSKTGKVYSQVVPRFVRAISPEEGAIVRKLYTDPLSRMARDMSADAVSAST